jgi:alpha-L-rhamnosidase
MFPTASERSRLLEVAQALKPELCEDQVVPVCTVDPIKSTLSPLGWKATLIPHSTETSPCVKGDSILYDFGNHFVGYLSFDVVACPREGGRDPCCPDSPARLRVVFGEVLPDVCESFEPFTYGVLPARFEIYIED